MIRVHKPDTPPALLTTNGDRECAALCSEYDAGERRFPESSFKQGIYAHSAVVQALIAAHRGKCCFCERRVDRAGQVEHYRPKAGIQAARGSVVLRPGYYWLAYSWDNLLLCCGDCNTRHKRNLFPLRDDTVRARCHTDDLNREDALLINPAERDPQEHITWRGTTPVGLDEYGRDTIAVLRLADETRRSDLIALRRHHLEEIRGLTDVIRLAPQLETSAEGRKVLADARRRLLNAQGENAPFLAMTQAALRTEFRDALTETGEVR